MSISDNARERARIARLKALESERQVQNFGEVGDSRVVVINYDPDKKAYLVRTLGGQIGYAMNISGTQLGVGATVQATRKGNGFIIDYFDQSSGKGPETNDTGNDISKDAFNNQNNTFFGGSNTTNNSNEGEDVWIAEADGSCTLRNYPTGQAPKDSFKTKAECRAAQDSDYNCEGAGVCKPVTRGTGKYKSKAACEAALIKQPFTGGQCAGVRYIVTGDVVGQSPSGGTWGIGNTVQVGGFQTTGIGPVTRVQTYDQQYINTSMGSNEWAFAVQFSGVWAVSVGVAIPKAFNGTSIRPTVTNIQITVAPNSPIQEPSGGCGNPAKVCPTT